jgi:hypothetical protein
VVPSSSSSRCSADTLLLQWQLLHLRTCSRQVTLVGLAMCCLDQRLLVPWA